MLCYQTIFEGEPYLLFKVAFSLSKQVLGNLNKFVPLLRPELYIHFICQVQSRPLYYTVLYASHHRCSSAKFDRAETAEQVRPGGPDPPNNFPVID